MYPFPGFHSEKPPTPSPPPPAHQPTHLLHPPRPGIPLHLENKPSQNQGPLFPLMSNKVILYYICNWSHGPLHVYSLAGGLVSGSSGGSIWLILLFFLWGCKPFSSFSPFSNSSIGDPVLSLMFGSERPSLYMSGFGTASQETAVSGSC